MSKSYKMDGAQMNTELAPIPMVLFCPNCATQHIDGPTDVWKNPPHRSHQCQRCAHIWRPADVFTEGVKSIETKGTADSSVILPISRIQGWKPHTGKNLSFEECRQLAQAILDYRGPPPYAPPEQLFADDPNRVALRIASVTGEAKILSDFVANWMRHLVEKEKQV